MTSCRSSNSVPVQLLVQRTASVWVKKAETRITDHTVDSDAFLHDEHVFKFLVTKRSL